MCVEFYEVKFIDLVQAYNLELLMGRTLSRVPGAGRQGRASGWPRERGRSLCYEHGEGSRAQGARAPARLGEPGPGASRRAGVGVPRLLHPGVPGIRGPGASGRGAPGAPALMCTPCRTWHTCPPVLAHGHTATSCPSVRTRSLHTGARAHCTNPPHACAPVPRHTLACLASSASVKVASPASLSRALGPKHPVPREVRSHRDPGLGGGQRDTVNTVNTVNTAI